MIAQEFIQAAAETAHNEGHAAASKFIADTLIAVEQAQGIEAAQKLSMGAFSESILIFQESAKSLSAQTLSECNRITIAASKAATNNTSKHWTGADLLRVYRDTCREIGAPAAVKRALSCHPDAFESVAISAIPLRLLRSTCRFMAEAGTAIVNAAPNQSRATEDMQMMAIVFNGAVVTPLCLAHEKLRTRSGLMEESNEWRYFLGRIPSALRIILTVVREVAFFSNHHAPGCNPFSELFVMELEAELATLEKALTA
jgi:hypothetical protein